MSQEQFVRELDIIDEITNTDYVMVINDEGEYLVQWSNFIIDEDHITFAQRLDDFDTSIAQLSADLESTATSSTSALTGISAINDTLALSATQQYNFVAGVSANLAAYRQVVYSGDATTTSTAGDIAPSTLAGGTLTLPEGYRWESIYFFFSSFLPINSQLGLSYCNIKESGSSPGDPGVPQTEMFYSYAVDESTTIAQYFSGGSVGRYFFVTAEGPIEEGSNSLATKNLYVRIMGQVPNFAWVKDDPETRQVLIKGVCTKVV